MNQVHQVVLGLARDNPTPRALALVTMLKEREYSEISNLRTSPHDYLDGQSFFLDNIFSELLRKCKLPSGVDTRAAAVDTFLKCEQQCAASNDRLYRYLPDSGLTLTSQESVLQQFFLQVRKDISSMLGRPPRCVIPKGFTNGATLSDKGEFCSIPDKICSTPTFYAHSLPFMWETLQTAWFRFNKDLCPARSNRFFTVPKDGKTDRGCCVEASVNITLQRDLAHHLVQRLKRWGIDITCQDKLHVEIAKMASVCGSFATVDSSNASDTICYNIVKLLFPEDWFTLLSGLRAQFTEVDGKHFFLEKFSSMGNGFTFEVETIIFAALARNLCRINSVDPDLVSAFGDDLLVPDAVSHLVPRLYELCGFTINVKKSYFLGPFRESCGGDFFDGLPVRGAYLKSLPVTPADWIALHNKLYKLTALGIKTLHARRACVEAIPKAFRLYGPTHLGDLCLHGPEASWTCKPVKGDTRTLVKVLKPQTRRLSRDRWSDDVLLACCTLISGTEHIDLGTVNGWTTQWVSGTPDSQWLPT